jgi:hypothetical protein
MKTSFVRRGPHAATPTKRRAIRCTVVASTPKRMAILRMLSPSWKKANFSKLEAEIAGREAKGFRVLVVSWKRQLIECES